MRLALKMGFSLVVLVAIALGLVNALNYYKYKTLLGSLVQSRMEVAAINIQSSVQSALRLGLSLADTRTAGDLIAVAKIQDPMILSVSIFETTPSGAGEIVYDTDSASVGRAPDPAWISSILGRSGEDATWSVSTDESSVIGRILVDRLDRPIGGIALRYDAHYERMRLSQMGEKLFSSAIEVLAGAVIFNIVLIILFFLPISARFRAMGNEIEAVTAGQAPSGAHIDPTLLAFGNSIRTANAAMDKAERAVGEIEQMEPIKS